jgi:hypothetical protein
MRIKQVRCPPSEGIQREITSLLRPLALDILGIPIALGLGAVALLVGRWSFRRRWARYPLIVLAVAGAGAVGASVLGFLPWAIYETVLEIGGAAVVVGWLGLLLLGVWWGRAPARRWESCVIVCLAAGMGGLIALQSGACLWWRLVRPELWERRADAGGGLQQATGWTCYPAAAVMLLHHYGIAAGEGEMAYSACPGRNRLFHPLRHG